MRALALLRDLPHLLAPLTAGCSSFHARWRAGGDATPPAGRWTGEWRSEHGHHGPLRCIVEVLDQTHWRATFRAGYARVFRACYSTELSIASTGGRLTFSGRSDLGRLAGGVYEYDGEVTRDGFTARYRSRYDRGSFRLTREDGRPALPPE